MSLTPEERSQAATPEHVERALHRFLDLPGAPDLVASHPDARRALLTLLDHGHYPTRLLERHPEWLPTLLDRRGSAPSWLSQAETALEDLPTDATRRAHVMTSLRAFKQRASLAVYLREILGEQSVRETTAGVADIAQACLEVALRESLRDAPELEDALCILGMGKLGGRELNYSSDVDLVVVCEERVFADLEQRGRAEDAVRSMISLLQEPTVDGFVFRVDLRLRPQGARGMLAHSIDAMVEYYLTWGRTWERAAWLKARPVAGACALGDNLLQALEPFLYRRHLDFGAIEDLRVMKQMVNQNAALSSIQGQSQALPEDAAPTPRRRRMPRGGGASSRLASRMQRRASRVDDPKVDPPDAPSPQADEGAYGWDVKIGAGGIREIEFFVQALQLVHCGKRPGLRVRNTLAALERLLYAGLISHDDAAALADAYDLYRRVEHRIQMAQDRQNHRLPEGAREFGVLASRMARAPDALRAQLDGHRAKVQEIFARLFESSERQSERPTLPAVSSGVDLPGLLESGQDPELARSSRAALARAGFERPGQIRGQLEMLSSKAYGPFSRRASAQFVELGRYLFELCGGTPDPDRAFTFITRLVTTVGDRPWFYKMLAENPHATRLLVHVFGSSEALSRSLLRDPNVIGRLLGIGSAKLTRTRAQMARDLRTRLAGAQDSGHRRGIMHRFQQEEFLRLALHEAAGAVTTRSTMEQLTWVAELLIEAMFEDVLDALEPGAPGPSELAFSVVGLGKLGSGELGFGSDLDIVFVYVAQGPWDHTFFAKLAQRLMRGLSAVGSEGRLYEVDARLRPSGRQGTLVVSADALANYHQTLAGVWERQAWLRSRCLTGSPEIRAAVTQIKREEVFGRVVPQGLRQEMALMRRRMLETAGLEGEGWDVKMSPGGIIDVEFLTQFLQLEFGVEGQQTSQILRTLSILEPVRRAYPDLALDELARDYEALRRIEALLFVLIRRGQTMWPTNHRAREALARHMGHQGEDAVRQVEGHNEGRRARVRAAYDHVFGR